MIFSIKLIKEFSHKWRIEITKKVIFKYKNEEGDVKLK